MSVGCDNRAMTHTDVTIRRAPRIGTFLVMGAVVGALGTLVLTSLFPADPSVGFAASYAYFCLYGVPIGVAIFGLLGALLDGAATRRARNATAERVEVGDPADVSAVSQPQDG